MAGRGEVGLQVVDRLPGGGVGERVVQVVTPASGLGVAVHLEADAVDDRGARPFGEGNRRR